MEIKSSSLAVPMILTTDDGTAIFRLNRDGSIETDWKRIEAMAKLWQADHHGWGVIIAKCFVEIAERIRAETEARFVSKSS